jgi:hypothetical protein
MNIRDRLSFRRKRQLHARLKIEKWGDEEGEVEIRWSLGVISEPGSKS